MSRPAEASQGAVSGEQSSPADSALLNLADSEMQVFNCSSINFTIVLFVSQCHNVSGL